VDEEHKALKYYTHWIKRCLEKNSRTCPPHHLKKTPRRSFPQVLRCTGLTLTVQQALRIYQKRWAVEVDNTCLKNALGLGDFRLQSFAQPKQVHGDGSLWFNCRPCDDQYDGYHVIDGLCLRFHCIIDGFSIQGNFTCTNDKYGSSFIRDIEDADRFIWPGDRRSIYSIGRGTYIYTTLVTG